MRHVIALILVILLFAVPWMMQNPNKVDFIFSAIQSVENQIAAVILTHNPKTIAEIKSRYNTSGLFDVKAEKIRILLVPGHEPEYGGTLYGSIKERELNVELATYLQQFLNNNRYEVVVTRDDKSWDPTFTNYWKNDWNDIVAWQKGHKNQVAKLTNIGSSKPSNGYVSHNSVPVNVALRLYGIGKWANENNIDIVIHIHFNDMSGHSATNPGKYNGFSIYVPQNSFYNSTTTKAVASSIFERLKKFNAVSDMPGESKGIVEDEELIAIGANNSVDAASMLIEYGYIYEPQFTDPALRSKALRDLAYQTYLGLQDFFNPSNAVGLLDSYDTLITPHKWSGTFSDGKDNTADVFALQTVLIREVVYPPAGKSLNDCPRTGTIGPCTRASLKAFQDKYGIKGEDGVVGIKTLDKLNSLYGVARQ